MENQMKDKLREILEKAGIEYEDVDDVISQIQSLIDEQAKKEAKKLALEMLLSDEKILEILNDETHETQGDNSVYISIEKTNLKRAKAIREEMEKRIKEL